MMVLRESKSVVMIIVALYVLPVVLISSILGEAARECDRLSSASAGKQQRLLYI